MLAGKPQDLIGVIGHEFKESNMIKVVIEVTEDQASAISKALDLYVRIGIGQLDEVAQIVAFGLLPVRNSCGERRQIASAEQCEQIRNLMDAAKQVLGFSRGASHGIGHPDNDISVSRAYEVSKVLNKVLAEHRNPSPEFRGVNYDGLGPRYTNDPAPNAQVVL